MERKSAAAFLDHAEEIAEKPGLDGVFGLALGVPLKRDGAGRAFNGFGDSIIGYCGDFKVAARKFYGLMMLAVDLK